MRGFLRRPPRPLPAWWPEGQPWPPVTYAKRPMPAWWPQGEDWPPRHARTGADLQFPIRIAVIFAIVLHLVVVGVVAIVNTVFGPFVQPLVWPVSGTLLVATVAGLFVVAMRRIGAPLTEIVAAAHRVADGDLSARVEERGLPWLRSLAHAFNTMTARLDRQQRERRELFADIAHELRTPLAVIQGRIEGMLDGVYSRDNDQVTQVLQEARALSRLIDDLRTSANAENGTLALQKEPTDLAVLIEETADLFRPDAAARRVVIDARIPDDLPIVAVDPLRLREVIANLLSNALRHAPEGSVVAIECSLSARSVVVRVSDEGPGIPEIDLERVFNRFFKGPTSTGSGLGLTIARSLVIAHGGTIAAARRESGGTAITVTLPR